MAHIRKQSYVVLGLHLITSASTIVRDARVAWRSGLRPKQLKGKNSGFDRRFRKPKEKDRKDERQKEALRHRENAFLFHGKDVADWQDLARFARAAALTYYEWPTIVGAYEGSRDREADVIRRFEDGFGVEARWRGMTLIVRDLPVVGMRYFVRIEDQKVHIAIKGSDNARNFRDDVDYAKIVDDLCDGARLHRGFKRVADAIWSDLLTLGLVNEKVKEEDPKKKKKKKNDVEEEGPEYELTGHSLGGGAATIIAMRLAARDLRVSKVVSFGAPKVTNARGAHLFASRVPLLRVLTNDDPVPTLPSMDFASHVFGFYRHFGHRLVLYEEEDDDDDDDHEEEEEEEEEHRHQRKQWVSLSPMESSGLPRRKETKVHRRYASRPDPRWLGAAFRREHDYWNVVKDTNLGTILRHNRVLLTARVKDFALWHLDESFLFHAHHVNAFAHTMDTYEAAVQVRQTARELVVGRGLTRRPLSRRRRKRLKTNGSAQKAGLQLLKKRGPFGACVLFLVHRIFKWRRVLRLLKPKYLILSFLFIGWTGSGTANTRANTRPH